MPRTKSAIKSARQADQRNTRLQPYKTQMKTWLRKISDAAEAGNKEAAAAMLPQVYKSIDMAAKKQLIHRKNADRKKALVSRMVSTKK